jgi:transcriptional regulator GlxA family with amidase domain
MNRRDALKTTAALGALLATHGAPPLARAAPGRGEQAPAALRQGNKITPPAKGKIPVAVLLSQNATVIDFTGPWEVFQDVHVHSRGATMEEMMPFQLFTIAESLEPVRCTAGLLVVPNYTFETAPDPRVVVVPAQQGRAPALLDWLRRVAKTADVTMSVCTGAFVLARAGLLAGQAATTHHQFQDALEKEYPDIKVQRGLRFVEGPKISSAGGLTSGIDLALRVVERYFGREVARATADFMEYTGEGWMS